MEVNIKFRTYTPLWSAGVDKHCNRLHETSIIGSLRFWYEVICRGLGISICDITSRDNQCLLDTGKYNQRIEHGKTTDEMLAEQNICAVCRVFGCGGWRRRFQLRIEGEPDVKLSFVSLDSSNKKWLEKIFGINEKAFFGDIKLNLNFFGNDTEFVKTQIQMLFSFIELFGALGAKMQYGFGHITMQDPMGMDENTIVGHMKELLSRTTLPSKSDSGYIYSLSNLVTVDCDVNENGLKNFLGEMNNSDNRSYIPCAFDLKYKGENLGFRQWLKSKNWQDDALNSLFGPSSQSVKNDEERKAGRVFFSMPYKRAGDDAVYHLRVFAFALPGPKEGNRKIDAKNLADLIEEYLIHAFDSNIVDGLVEKRYGSDLIKKVKEG